MILSPMKAPLAFILFFLTASLYGTNIIFDMHGVLMRHNNFTSYRSIITSIITNRSLYFATPSPGIFLKTKKRVMEFLGQIKPRGAQEAKATVGDGMPMPQIMCDWFKGNLSSDHVQQEILSALENSQDFFESKLEKEIIQAITHMLCTPASFAHMHQWNQDVLGFVRNCKKNKHKVFILSNWDKESFSILQETYQDIFDLFDGIVISGNVHSIKPEKAIYNFLLNEYRLEASNCIFIDDQEENIEAAKNIGMYGIFCPQKRSFLMPWNKKPDLSVIKSKFAEWEKSKLMQKPACQDCAIV